MRDEAAVLTPRAPADLEGSSECWNYDAAFARNRGLISEAEQRRLRECTVAVVGLGGVGGVHVATLARLGVGGFRIADPDRFEIANFNRQLGATTHTLGHNKAEVIAGVARSINPDVRLLAWSEAITAANVGAFLEGADLLIDGIDFFAPAARRLVFAEARRRGLWALTAGPVGFSSAWIAFDPRGLSFDDYFDLRDDMDHWDQLAAFAVGLAPRATHWSYLDLTRADPRAGTGPSVGLACQLCAGIAAAEALKILLQRGPLRPAPYYFQFDAYRQLLRKGRRWGGNRHPWQRFKRWYLRRRFGV